MNDIGKELYERVRADFERRLAADKRPPKDMRGVSDYSARVGRYLAEAIAANVTEDALPDGGTNKVGTLYYNIAESILEPSLRTNYELVNDTAAEVQRLLDERQGLRIKPARADYPEERVHAVIGAASEEGIGFDRALRRMTSPAENITQSFADDFMQANAAQRSRAGFDTFIERQGGLNCCPWCAGLVGVFAYPKGLPKEVFARHDNCTCSVTYGTKGGARQNVWTKAKWNVPPIQEPHRMTAEEAAEKGAFAQPRRLTGGVLSDIIGDAILKEVPITDEAIDKVPKIYFNGISDEQAERLVALHKQLLQEAQKYAVGTECSITCDLDFQMIALTVGREGEGNVDIPSPGEFYYFGLHNHPSCETFGLTDLKLFTDDDFMLALTDIGNNSHLRVIFKTSEFDSTEFANYFSDCCSKKIYKGKTILEINRDYVNSLDQHEKERVLQIVVNHLENTLKGGAKYGLSYTEKSPSD